MKRTMWSSLLVMAMLGVNAAPAAELKTAEEVIKHLGADTVEAAVAKVTRECNEGRIESTYTSEIQNAALHSCLSGMVGIGSPIHVKVPPHPWTQAQLVREAQLACKKRYEQVLKAVTDLDSNNKDWASELKELKQYTDGDDKEMRRYFWSVGNGDCNSVIGLERHFCKVKTANFPRYSWKIQNWVLADDPADEPGLPRVDESVRKAGTARTLDLGGGVKLELVWIPAGEFMMGSRKGEVGRFVIEPRHRVKLTKGFWMGKYEVTQEQWEKVMGYNPSGFTNAGPRAPVECVSRNDSQRFMLKLNRSAAAGGGKFRLPTEAEWEWACRAGTDGPLYTGTMTIKGANNSPELDAIAWYAGNSGVEYEGAYGSSKWPDKQREHRLAGTHPVGGKKPNAWGLHDMLGNVREWCEDAYRPYIGPRKVAGQAADRDATGESSDPGIGSRSVTDPVATEGDWGGDLCIQRGGCWSDLARQCRCPNRHAYVSGGWAWNRSSGFRAVMEE